MRPMNALVVFSVGAFDTEVLECHVWGIASYTDSMILSVEG
jgi:hypothetical protein